MPGTIRHFPASDPAWSQPVISPLPDLLVEDAGSIYDGYALDITRICHVHQWASLRVPVEKGIDPPRCELCLAETLAVEGRARYADLVAKREAGVI